MSIICSTSQWIIQKCNVLYVSWLVRWYGICYLKLKLPAMTYASVSYETSNSNYHNLQHWLACVQSPCYKLTVLLECIGSIKLYIQQEIFKLFQTYLITLTHIPPYFTWLKIAKTSHYNLCFCIHYKENCYIQVYQCTVFSFLLLFETKPVYLAFCQYRIIPHCKDIL